MMKLDRVDALYRKEKVSHNAQVLMLLLSTLEVDFIQLS